MPLADMLNTALPHTSDVDFQCDGQNFTMTALRDINSGAQIKDSYGYKSNERYFLNYGFSFEENTRVDGTSLNSTSIVVGPPRHGSKRRIWGENALRVALDMGRGDGAIEARAAQTLSLLRFQEASDDELASLFSGPLRGLASLPVLDPGLILPRLASIPKLGPLNEARALDSFSRLCSQALSRYPTSLAEDDAHLLMMDKYSRSWNSRVQVRGEKQILAYWQQVTSERRAEELKKGLVEWSKK